MLMKIIIDDNPKQIKEFRKVHDRGNSMKLSSITLNWLGRIKVPYTEKCLNKEMGTEEEEESA